MATYTGELPTVRGDGTTKVDFDAVARLNTRLADWRIAMEVAANFALVGPANVRLPVTPRQTRFPKLP